MKKVYILAVAVLGMVFTANAQIIDDDFESYPLGSLHQDPWSTWSGNAGAEDIIVDDTQALSGAQSGFIGAGPGPQDALLLLGNLSSGTYTIIFQMFIPTGKTGYFNIQGTTVSGGAGDGGNGVFNSPNLVFNNTQSANGAPGLGGAYPNIADANPAYSWSYPENTWFEVKIVFDIDAGLWTMTVDGSEIAPQPFDTENVLGAIDFFAIDANNEYYIDDVLFDVGILGTDNFATTNFSMYPNPVQNELHIRSSEKIDAVTIYNILGKVVYQTQPNTTSPNIDTSNFSSGMYLVDVTIDGVSETVKVLK